MKKNKSKNKKVVIAVSGMILAVSIGTVGFKYKNEVIKTVNLSEYDAQSELEILDTNNVEEVNIGESNIWKVVEESRSRMLRISNDGFLTMTRSADISYFSSDIKKYDYKGNLLFNLEDKINELMGDVANEVLDVGVNPNNNNIFVFFSNGFTLEFDSNGNYINKIASRGAGRINYFLDDGIIIAGNLYNCNKSKISYDGNVIWDNSTGFLYRPGIIECIKDGDNDIIITHEYRDKLESKLYKINTSGEIIYEKNLPFKYSSGRPKVTKIKDGFIAIEPVTDEYGNKISGEGSRIIKFDFNGNIIFDKVDEYLYAVFDGNIQHEIKIKSSSNGFFVYSRDNDLKESIREYNNNGDLVKIINLNDVNFDDLEDFIVTDDLIIVRLSENYDGTFVAIENSYLDKSKLIEILEKVENLTKSDYSEESWNKLQEVINGADSLTSQEEIDAKVDEIQNAIDNLGIDRSALDKAIEDAGKLVQTDYSVASWQALQNALAGTDGLTKQSEIDAKAQEIQTAIANLTVDRSALDKVIEDAGKLVQTDYSAESWQVLQNALEGTDNLTKQNEIDAKVQEIQNAINNLMGDRSELDDLLDHVGDLVESDYSEESWNKLQEAVSGAEDLKDKSEIDAKVEEIQDAIDNLGTDRSELDGLLEQVGSLEESDYSEESWNKLQEAIAGAEDLTKQSEIDAKVEEIKDAIESLGTDRSELDGLLEQVGSLTESDYSDSSWDALQEAIAGAEDLTKQSEIDAKVEEIQDAIESLGTDRSELDGLLEQVGSLTESDYSDSSWDALQEAVAGAEDLTKQSEIDAKVEEIKDAINNLGTDRSELDGLLEQVGSLTESDYSDSSWDALQQAIAGADTLTKQSEIDAKVQEIQNAMTNLTVDRSVLDTLLDNISKLNSSDYSEESWQALQNALAGTDGLTKQSEIDAKVEEIKNAVNGLGIDRSELDILLEEVGKLVETDYSKASWDVLENAVNMADTVTTQSQIEEVIAKIQDAMSGLTIDRSQLDGLLEEVKKLKMSMELKN